MRRLVKMVDGRDGHREFHYGYAFRVGSVRSVEDRIAEKLLRGSKFVEVKDDTVSVPSVVKPQMRTESALLPRGSETRLMKARTTKRKKAGA